MTLDDKRKVIEVLLCCGQDADSYTETTGDTARHREATQSVHVEASRQWIAARRDANAFIDHGKICITAAYRLIESSPTLRREWFGTP